MASVQKRNVKCLPEKNYFLGFVSYSWFFMGFVVFPACRKILNSAKEQAAIERVNQEKEITPLTEKEAELWAEVYAAAVGRGVWYPAKRANAAIIELRKITGGAE